MIKALIRCHGDEQRVKEELSRIPSTMEQRYEAELLKVDENNIEKLKSILMWISVPMRPMSREEIIQLSGIRTDNEFDELCPSSLIKNRKGSPIGFAHFSVKEYLNSTAIARSPNERLSQFFMTEDLKHREMAKRCLHLLGVSSQSSDNANYKESVKYAAQNWFRHVKAADEKKFLDHDSESLIRKFLRSGPQGFLPWLRIFDPDDDGEPADLDKESVSSGSDSESLKKQASITDSARPLYYAIHLGLFETAKEMIGHDKHINSPGGRWGTALQLASSRGYTQLAQQLIEHDADVNAQGGYHGSALYVVSSQGPVAIVEKLLKEGADANRMEATPFHTALQVAAYRGSIDIVKLLIKYGANVNTTGGVMYNALQAASAAGHLNIVSVLIEKGANINDIGGPFRTALIAARVGGHDKISEKLKAKGAKNHDSLLCWSHAYDLLRQAEYNLDDMKYADIVHKEQRVFEELMTNQQRLFAAAFSRSCDSSMEDPVHSAVESLERQTKFRVPLNYHLLAMKRAIPRQTYDLEEFGKSGFQHRALFYAGINSATSVSGFSMYQRAQ